MTQLVIAAGFAVLGTLFLCASPALRTALILASLFVAALEIDLGFGLNLPVLLGLLSGFLVLTGRVGMAPPTRALLLERLLPFFAWVLLIWTVGFLALEPLESIRGWSRGSEGKPLVQLARFFLLIPMTAVVADGLRRPKDLRRLSRAWIVLAAVSALYCIVQILASALLDVDLGVYNVHQDSFRRTVFRFADAELFRASGLAGEPKAQGMAMAFSLCFLLASWERARRGPATTQLVVIVLVGTALVLTFSAGAAVMTLALPAVLFLPGSAGPRTRSLLRVGIVVGLLAAALAMPVLGLLWEQQVSRRISVFTDPSGGGWGEDKERPALVHLLENPTIALTGVGPGVGVFHFRERIRDREFRDKLVAPNSGLIAGLYSYGLVGSILLLAGARRELLGVGVDRRRGSPATALIRFVFLYHLVYTPSWWLIFALGLASSRAVEERRANDRSSAALTVRPGPPAAGGALQPAAGGDP